MHWPTRTPSFLPWLCASMVLHALLLTAWPDAARQPPGAGAAHAVPIRIQVSEVEAVTVDNAAQRVATDRPPPSQPLQASPVDRLRPGVPPERVARRATAAVAAVPGPSGPSDRPGPAAPQSVPQAAPQVAAGTVPPEAAPQTAGSTVHDTVHDTGPAAEAAWLELAALLHQAIDRHKRYPQGALRLGREGAARIDFRLAPDGSIDDLNIGHSSGVRSLDLAAFRAVQAIAPFADAHRYLDRTRRFQVDVIFQLN
ncbi:MAG: TonB family protein [Lysobacteraceae bacterium]